MLISLDAASQDQQQLRRDVHEEVVEGYMQPGQLYTSVMQPLSVSEQQVRVTPSLHRPRLNLPSRCQEEGHFSGEAKLDVCSLNIPALTMSDKFENNFSDGLGGVGARTCLAKRPQRI